MEIKAGQTPGITAGTWNYKVIANGGTASLSYQVSNEAPIEIPGTAVSADTGLSIELPTCKVTATVTGGAEVFLSKVNGSK